MSIQVQETGIGTHLQEPHGGGRVAQWSGKKPFHQTSVGERTRAQATRMADSTPFPRPYRMLAWSPAQEPPHSPALTPSHSATTTRSNQRDRPGESMTPTGFLVQSVLPQKPG